MTLLRDAACCALLLAAGWSAGAQAGSIVIYRCTDAFGRLTVQNDVPCPKGSRQRKQVVDPPPPMPAYRPAPPSPAPAPPLVEAPAATLPPSAPATPLPPPPLFRCRTAGDDSHFGEDETPAPRCLALPVVGLDGSPSAAGTACQMVRDTCERIPDGDACEAWRQYAREAEAAWRFGRAEDGAKHEADFERIQRLLRESTCAQAGPAP